jgi:hypothetical protein
MMTEAEPIETSRDSTRLRTLLQAFEAELHELGRLTETAQNTLSGVLLRAADDPACHRNAQVLDVLTQRLFGMSGFLKRLAPEIPRVWQVNTAAAVNALSLGALVDRLNGVPAANTRQETGELELF